MQLKWHRLSKPLSFQRLVLEAYRYLSRYGEDPRQAAEVLFYLFVLLSGVLALGGFEQLGQPPYAITGKQVSGFFLSLTQSAFFIKPAWTPSAVFDALALFISRLVIPIQAAIFGIALRNKLHR